MRPVPPRSAEEIRDFPWKRDPSLIHAPLIHVCDRLTSVTSTFRDVPLALQASLRPHTYVSERREGDVTEGDGFLGVGLAAPDQTVAQRSGPLSWG